MKYEFNYYELLEVRETASSEVISMAFKALARKYHPDIFKGDYNTANKMMQKINEAYDVLSDPIRRKQYDEYIAYQKYTSYAKDQGWHEDTNTQYKESQDTETYKRRENEYSNFRDDSTTENRNIKKVKVNWSLVFILATFIVISSYFSSRDSKSISNNNETNSTLEYKYSEGVNSFLSKNYEDACKIFEDLGNYKNSNEMALKSKYNIANLFYYNEDYEKALYLFEELGDYSNSAQKANYSKQKINREIDSVEVVVENRVIEHQNISPSSNLYNSTDAVTMPVEENYITLGSNQDIVKSVMGTPDAIHDYGSFIQWSYNLSSITFDKNGSVEGWNNLSNNLKLYLGDKDANASYITIGSTSQDVIKAMGTPDAIFNYGSFIQWSYDLSSITFDKNGNVEGWNNLSNNLKIYLGDKDANASYITIGSTSQDVIKAMGTPDAIFDYGSFIQWGYDLSSITFDNNGNVKEWNNLSNNLIVQ